ESPSVPLPFPSLLSLSLLLTVRSGSSHAFWGRAPVVAGAGVRTPSEARRPEVGRVGPGAGVPPVPGPPLGGCHHPECANARVGSAIFRRSSLRLIAAPSPLPASISSAASRSDIVFSRRWRAYPTIQRIASVVALRGRTSTGTWYVAPPTRRLFTSSTGRTFSTARLTLPPRSVPVLRSISASASYTIRSDSDRFPRCRSLLTSWVTTTDRWTGSGIRSRRGAEPFRGIGQPSRLAP